MKLKLIKIANLIIAALFTLFVAGYVFAWFTGDMINRELEMEGASAAYFEDGSGTEEDPFIITNERHIYNLAWLNNTGRFGTNKYYFKVANNVVISDNDWIPPIGTDSNPFYGEFDGQGATISGLKVTTDKNKLKNSLYGSAYAQVTEADYTFSNAVGFFGKTAEGSNITNFILEDPTVVVSTDNSKYSDAGNKVVGLAIGHVADSASSIGVKEGNLAVEVSGYKSFNSILGELGAVAQNNMSAGSSGNMDGDTGYFIPDSIMGNINSVDKFFNSDGSVVSSNTWLVSGQGNTLGLGSFSVVTSSSSDQIRSTTVDNFSYYPASEGNVFSSSTCTPISLSLSSRPSDATAAAVYDDVVDKNGNHINILHYAWYFQSTATTGTDMSDGKNEYVQNNLTVISEDNNYMLYDGSVAADQSVGSSSNYNVNTGGIKVNITEASETNPSKIFVIAASAGNEVRSVGLYKISSENNPSYDDFAASGANKYETLVDKDNPLMQLNLPADRTAAACYFTVTSPGVYHIQSTKAGINFYYLSVEGVADGQGGEPPATERFALDNIDFIEENDVISDGNIMSGTSPYNPTETWVFINALSNAIYVSYTRKNLNSSYTLGITLYSSFNDETDALSGEVAKTNNVYVNAYNNYGIEELPFDGQNHKVQELEGNDIPDDIIVGPTELVCYYTYNGSRILEGAEEYITIKPSSFTLKLSDYENYSITGYIVKYNDQVISEDTGVNVEEGTHEFYIQVTCKSNDGSEQITLSERKLTIIISRHNNSFTVTFDGNLEGTTVNGIIDPYDVTDGSTITEPAEPKAEGYTFGGWYTDSNCTDGNEFDFVNTQITEDTTLYAKWTENAVQTYTVTFETNGGSTIEAVSVEAGGCVARPSSDPTKDGYTFGGWYTDNTFETLFDFDTTTINSNTTIYAQWIEDTTSGEMQVVATIKADDCNDGYTLDTSVDSGYIDNGYIRLETGNGEAEKTAVPNGNEFVAIDDSNLSFKYAFFATGNGTTIKITASKACTIKYYYTITDSSWAIKNKSLILSGSVSQTITLDSMENNKAYCVSVSMNAGDELTIAPSDSRLVTFAVVVETPAS